MLWIFSPTLKSWLTFTYICCKTWLWFNLGCNECIRFISNDTMHLLGICKKLENIIREKFQILSGNKALHTQFNRSSMFKKIKFSILFLFQIAIIIVFHKLQNFPPFHKLETYVHSALEKSCFTRSFTMTYSALSNVLLVNIPYRCSCESNHYVLYKT